MEFWIKCNVLHPLTVDNEKMIYPFLQIVAGNVESRHYAMFCWFTDWFCFVHVGMHGPS